MTKATKKAMAVVAGSAIGYLVSRHTKADDAFLYILLGGLAGTIVGEELIEESEKTASKPQGHLSAPFFPDKIR